LRITIGRKLAILALAALVGVLALTLLFQHEAGRVFDGANYANINTVPSFIDLGNAQRAMLANRTLVWQHFSTSDPATLAGLERDMAANDAKLAQGLDSYEKNDLSNDEDRRLLEADRAAAADYQNLRDRVLALSRAGKKAEARDLAVGSATIVKKFTEGLEKHYQFNVDLAKKTAADASAVKSSAFLLSMLVGAATMVLMGIVAYLIGRRIVRSVGACVTLADGIAKGDLTVQFPAAAEDETGDLVRSLKRLLTNIQNLVADSEALTEAAVAERFDTRADASRHAGEFGRIVEGFNRTLDVVVDKLAWYQAIVDAVPFPIHVIDADMKWVFLNKAFEKLMVEQGYVRDRQDAVGRPCATANANICNTEKCGIMQLKRGKGESFFDWCGMSCKQDTSRMINVKGQHVGYVEVVQDLSATLNVHDFTKAEVDRLASALAQLAQGDLSLELKTQEAGKYTVETKAQFDRIHGSLAQLKNAIGSLMADTRMLTEAALAERFDARADASRHTGDYRRIVEGFNQTLDVVVDKLAWNQAIIDAVPFPIHVIDADMKWVFLNKAFEKLMVEQHYIRDRKEAVGMPCATANANICNTEKCGIMQLKRGKGESFFDWCGMSCKQDTSRMINIKGQHVGYVEVVQDLSATLNVRDYTNVEVDRLAGNLVQLAQGDLNLELKTQDSGKYTVETKTQFDRINASMAQLKGAIGHLVADTTMLSKAAVAGQLATRADASQHQGDFRRIVQGVDDTLDAVIGPLNVAASYVDRISQGEIPPRITDTYQGDFNTLKNNLNRCIDGLQGLVEANHVLQRLAGNDFTSRVKGEYLGIFAEVAKALNETIDNQAKALTEVQDSAFVVAQSSGEIATGNQELSARTEEQASSLEETASSLEQFTSMVNQTAENARSASGAAAQARTVADEGSKAVEQLVGSMDAINAASSRINEIISVVDEIAFQTNLLALNAAVEAARAGEQGRGFAVVATEVRNLAKRSADAAKEIKGLIKDSVSKAQDGQKVAARTGQIILDVVANVQKVSEIMADIANATHEQTMGIGEINKAVTQMDETTQHNAALVEEAAASAENLDQQAQNLKQIVAQYQLGTEARAAQPAAATVRPTQPPPAGRNGKAQERHAPPAPPRRRPAKVDHASVKGSALPPKGEADEWESF
jgi:methyl-accepting chemotaxis protein